MSKADKIVEDFFQAVTDKCLQQSVVQSGPIPKGTSYNQRVPVWPLKILEADGQWFFVQDVDAFHSLQSAVSKYNKKVMIDTTSYLAVRRAILAMRDGRWSECDPLDVDATKGVVVLRDHWPYSWRKKRPMRRIKENRCAESNAHP